MEDKKRWLSHLIDSIPREAHGYPVTMYSIALEGWRRGLTLKFINNRRNWKKAGIEYSLTYNGKEHRFIGSRTRLITKEAIKICVNKDLTKQYLSKAGIPIPLGEIFRKENADEEIINYAKTIGYPLVLKPSNGEGGKGVIANIKSEKQFKDALKHVRYELNYKELIVEKFFEGEDYRLFVIGDDVVGAIYRIPANVIGDGVNSIKQLLEKKLLERNKNPALFRRPIQIDKEMIDILNMQGYTLDNVPNNGERVNLKTKNNISAGGDPIDVTDELTEEVKMNAIKAIKSIPGLLQGGVDVLFNKQNKTGVVIEVNTQPSIRTHLFPMEGQARDVPKKIIDYYFPETISNKLDNQPLYYFDIQNVFETFRSGIIKEITIPNVPKGELMATRFRLTGKLRGVNYENWVQARARNLNLNGYIMHLKNGETSIVVSGSVDSINEFRKILINESPVKTNITKIVEKERSKPVKIGFEIR
ncbi:acylphosphatase [Oceanobacillus profundus]|uniref:acylphosphatase n=1 Tax=Oceanobacillus TaxID=182709 RepID=UPI0026E1C3B8|nr:acylphosphatase [Oceanobacillus profundus]MDO6451793.1 acylphosphatase [Oceanobacillus profundus]